MDDQSILFSAVEMNGLFVQKLDDNKAELRCKFTEEDEVQDNLHSQIVVEGETLYFIPLEGRGISKYDLKTGKLRTILFKKGGALQVYKSFSDRKRYFFSSDEQQFPFLCFSYRKRIL